jgi:hypothetical protein
MYTSATVLHVRVVLRGLNPGRVTSPPGWLIVVWSSPWRGDMAFLSRIWFMSLIVEEDD